MPELNCVIILAGLVILNGEQVMKKVFRPVKRGVQGLLNRYGYSLVRTGEAVSYRDALAAGLDLESKLPAPYSRVEFAGEGLRKLIEDYDFDSVLDVGAGSMSHSRVFAEFGKRVTAVDYGNSVYFKRSRDDHHGIDVLIGDFNAVDLQETFDCVWASHVLEHQVNADLFLKKLHGLLNFNGVLAVTVPPMKHEIVGGHVSLWNAGLLLYRLVLAGFDCRDAAVRSYGYNITVIVRKGDEPDLSGLQYDCGDIRKLKSFLPEGLKFNSNENDDPFDGNIECINW